MGDGAQGFGDEVILFNDRRPKVSNAKVLGGSENGLST